MKPVKTIIPSILSLFFTIHFSFAQISQSDRGFNAAASASTATTNTKSDLYSLKDLFGDSSLSIRWQIDGSKNDTTSVNRIVFRPRINLTIPLSDRFRLKTQAQTGATYTSGWDRIVTMDETKPNFPENLAIRRMYLEYEATKNSTIQFGALQVGSQWVEPRPFGLDTDGWIDGLRVVFKEVFENVDQLQVLSAT